MNTGYNIQGKNVHIYKFIDTTPFEIVCGTNIVLEFQQELIGATTPESGKSFEVRPRMRNITATISGATTSTNDGNLSIFHFLDDTVFSDVQDLQIVYTDNNGNTRTVRCNFFIERIPVTAEAENASTYDINLKSSGEYTVSTLTDPTVTGTTISSQSYTVSSGKISDAAWIGLGAGNIVGLYREGAEQLSLGLPYTFNSGTGEITPDPATTIDGQRMFVIWTHS